MPKVLLLVFALACLIATNVSAVEPQGFVLKGAFVNDDGSVSTVYFPGEGKVAIFRKLSDCEVIKNKADAMLKEQDPDMQFIQACIPTPKEISRGLEKRPKA
jgi:hypothetical protein